MEGKHRRKYENLFYDVTKANLAQNIQSWGTEQEQVVGEQIRFRVSDVSCLYYKFLSSRDLQKTEEWSIIDKAVYLFLVQKLF